MKGKGAIGVDRDAGQMRYREASVWKQGRYEETYRVVGGGGACMGPHLTINSYNRAPRDSIRRGIEKTLL